jgi:hypothetical protein
MAVATSVGLPRNPVLLVVADFRAPDLNWKNFSEGPDI